MNDRARERWAADTDGFDRVRSVLTTVVTPVSAGEVADSALVMEKTARKHLDRLAELGFAACEQDGRTTRYRRDRDDEVSRRVRELAAEHSRSELLAGIERMHGELAEYRERLGVETPEEYALSSGESAYWTVLHDWEGTRRNLALARAALAYGRARDLAET